MRAPAVTFENVSKIYRPTLCRRGGIRALDGVSLTVERGEVLGLVGPNRAGKTTLVKILLSICRESGGRVTRLGQPHTDRRTLAQVGYVHESQAFPRYLTATQLLDYYGALTRLSAKEIRPRAAELLARLGLADRSHEPIARFSKGMVQRLAVAQALINDPELLVLDEPGEGMDLCARRLLHDLLNERRQQGKTAILVSHSLADVERLCDRVAVIRGGKLARCSTVADLTADADRAGQHALEDALEPLYAGASA